MIYSITCLQCSQSDNVEIDNDTHQVLDYEKKADTNFLALRWRGDLQWGFQCRCGNDNRLARTERERFDELVQGDSVSLQSIADGLQVEDALQFRMETA